MKKFLIPLALVMVMNLGADTYFVNSSVVAATDKNPGTKELPWFTIRHGVDNAKPGDTIIVMPGTYERTTIKKSGTKGALITIKGFITPTQKHVDKNKIFDPLKPSSFPGSIKENAVSEGFYINGASYIRVENFEITAVNGIAGVFLKNADNVEIIRNFLHDLNPGEGKYGGVRTDDHDSDNVLVKDNTFFRCPGTSVIIMGDSWVVEGNEISHGTNCNTETGAKIGGEDAVRIFGTNHIIRYNYIHDFLDEEQFPKSNPHLDAFQSFSENPSAQFASDILIESNYCVNIGQMFMGSDTNEMKTGNNSIHNFTFKNNVFRGAHAYAIIIGRGCDNFTFVNNVVADSFYGGVIITEKSHHAVVENNIFFNNSESSAARGARSGQMSIDESSKPDSVIDYNIQNEDYTYPKKDYSLDKNSIYEDPGFVGPKLGDYRLQSGSPAIDKGDPSFPVPAGGGKRIDIGAFEYGAKGTDWFLKYLLK